MFAFLLTLALSSGIHGESIDACTSASCVFSNVIDMVAQLQTNINTLKLELDKTGLWYEFLIKYINIVLFKFKYKWMLKILQDAVK